MSNLYEPIKVSRFNVKEALQHVINMMEYDQIDSFKVSRGLERDYKIELFNESEEGERNEPGSNV